MSTPEENTPAALEESAEAKLSRAALVERVRAWVEVRLQETSLRDLADETGIAKSTIDKFVRGNTVPDNRTWPKLRLWYLQDRQARRASMHDPESMALLFLTTLENIPARARTSAIRSMVDYLRMLHREASAPEPEWLDVLLRWSEEGAAIPQRPEPEAPKPRRGGRRRGL